MVKTKIVTLASGVAQKIIDGNNARKGWKVVNLDGTSVVRVKPVAAPGTSDANQVQTITFVGTPTSGTWKVKYNGNLTTALAHNINAASLQTALRLLAGLGSVTVSGSVGAGFAVTLAGVGFPPLLLSVEENSLTTAGTDEVQTLSFATKPSKGTFALGYKIQQSNGLFLTQRSDEFTRTTSSATLQAALRLLLNNQSVSVSGSILAGLAITIPKAIVANLENFQVFSSLKANVVEAIQAIAFDDTPASGNFKLNYGDLESADIAFNANAAAVQTALRALAGLEYVSVTGSVAAGFEVTFAGVPGNPALLTVTDNTLETAGEVAVEIEVTEDTEGSNSTVSAAPTIALTTPGVAQAAVPGSVAITTPGSSDSDGESIATNATLDRSDNGGPASLYAIGTANGDIEVTEVF